MRSGLLSLFLVTIVLGFVVGLYATVALPAPAPDVSQPGAAGAASQVSYPVSTPSRGLQTPLEYNPYRQPILLVAVVASVAAIMTGLLSRSEGVPGARSSADTVITLAVVALMLLAIHIVVALLVPFLGSS
jgi:hypothetical protein